MIRFLRSIIIFLVLLGLIFGAWRYHRSTYPYGWSHSCDKVLGLALRNYAEEHGGAYPAGQATPEASLSLLYPKYVDAEVLRGKTVPRNVVQAILDRGELLSPDTCGWHYVEGLRLDDDPRLALVWDKVGLGHNGQRLPQGGHAVICGNGPSIVEADKWGAFLQEQQQLLAVRKKGP